MMITGIGALPRGEGGFPAPPGPMKHPCGPAQPRPAKMVETGEQWRGKRRFTLSNLFNSEKPIIEEYDNTEQRL